MEQFKLRSAVVQTLKIFCRTAGSFLQPALLCIFFHISLKIVKLADKKKKETKKSLQRYKQV